MLIRGHATTLLQIYCELLLHSLVIFKSMRVAVLSNGTLSVNGLRVPPESTLWNYDTFDHIFVIENDFTKYLKESFH